MDTELEEAFKGWMLDTESHMDPSDINYQKELMDLLCIIHGDRGHYIAQHGEAKAIQDARKKVSAYSAATAEFIDTAFSWSVILKNGR